MPDQHRSTPERLADPIEREALWAAISEHGSVNKAAKALGLDRIYIYTLARQDDQFASELLAAEGANFRQLVDECVAIADTAHDKDSAASARVRVDTRLRIAGKILPKIYGDQPTTAVSVQNVVGIIVDEPTRLKLIEQREKLLADRPEQKQLQGRTVEIQDATTGKTVGEAHITPVPDLEEARRRLELQSNEAQAKAHQAQ